MILMCLVVAEAARAQFSCNVYWTEQTNMPASETIYYSAAHPLRWADFKGRAETHTPAVAVTASGFGYKADYKGNAEKMQLNIGVYCYFSKQNSWVRPGRGTVYILNHEQQHFDISFIAANIFFQKLKSVGLTAQNYKATLPKIYNECVELMNRLQKIYDGQTQNGQLREEQAKWDAYLQKQLQDFID